MSYSDENKSNGATHDVKYEGEVMIPMRDGVRLAADLFVPMVEGKFPALVAYGVWSKELSADLQWKYPPQPPPSFVWSGSIEGGDSEFLISHGYAHIIVQTRGTGHSEGLFEEKYRWVGRAADAYDLIEWVAKQPWCDGNVGMIGISAYGAAQLWAAIQAPPHLKAIFPYDSPTDLYRDGFFDGGVLSLFHAGLRPAANAFDQKRMEERKKMSLDIRQKMRSDDPDFLVDYTLSDFQVYTKMYNTLMHPGTHPILFDLMTNPFDGEEYKAKSYYPDYEKVSIPVYCGSGWYTVSYTHLPGAFRTWTGVKNTKAKKMIIGPDAHGPGDRWFHLERPWHQYHDEIVRWYDYWLKGIDTGILTEPPIKLFVMGANRWRYENEWPLARTVWTKFYLRSFKRLMEEPPAKTETSPDAFVQQPLNTTNEIGRLEYQTQPLPMDMEVTGPVAVYLYGAIHCENHRWPDTNWIVVLKDVLLNGEERELSRGWLKASHRALDTGKSRPYQPYHPHTREALEKLEMDRIYEYAVEVRPTSNVFKEGHRIKMDIVSAELPAIIVDRAIHVARNDVVMHKVYRSKVYPSHVLLPVIPSTDSSQWLSAERAKYLPSLFDGTATVRTTANAY